MEDNMDYVVFTVKASDGSEVEMAIVDEFDYENKHYIVSVRVVDGAVSDEGQYIYRARITGDDFVAEKITNKIDYEKIVTAYMEMD